MAYDPNSEFGRWWESSDSNSTLISSRPDRQGAKGGRVPQVIAQPELSQDMTKPEKAWFYTAEAAITGLPMFLIWLLFDRQPKKRA